MKSIIVLIIILGIFIIMLNLINNEDKIINEQQNIQFDGTDKIIIPVKVHIIKENSGIYSSNRDEENIRKLFENVNEIWSQADVRINIEDIVITKVEDNTIPNVMNGNTNLLTELNDFDKNTFNAYFASNIGPNGIAFIRQGSFIIADKTSVHDFRTTSHELGHLLGLVHVSDINQLMFRGSNGMRLSEEEINLARKKANIIFN